MAACSCATRVHNHLVECPLEASYRRRFGALQVNIDIDKFLEQIDNEDDGFQGMDHVNVSEQPASISTSTREEVSVAKCFQGKFQPSGSI